MKKRFVVCGVSTRAIHMFINNMVKNFSDSAELVGWLDKDPRRFEVARQVVPGIGNIPGYSEKEFDKMIAETKPDVVIATGMDCTHAGYIIKALEKNLDVWSEKPMTSCAADARKVLDAEKKSKGRVIVTFNYRYPTLHRKIKELILEDKVGKITHVDLNWYIDTYHGASYFNRWNRERENSGGLSIHKATHHFDLINWWTAQNPVQVFAFGALNYYGANGALNPRKADDRHCSDCPDYDECPYVSRWMPKRGGGGIPKDDHLGTASVTDGKPPYTTYRRDRCIFDSSINIEDTYTATVKYDQGALLSYSCNFCTPFEGYDLAINGTKGRIESRELGGRTAFPHDPQVIYYYPLFGARETIEVVHGDGGHGGGDPVLLKDLFIGVDPKRGYEIQAGAKAGAYSVALGEAVWKSAKENRPFMIEELLGKM
jgi:predicted dehydrogenase